MHVLGTGVPRRLGVARSASSAKAVQDLGCSLTPGLRISFGRVTCMAWAASVPGLWTLRFLLLCGVCDWVRVVLGCGFGNPASPGWGLGWVCLGTVCGVAPLLPAGVCGVCGWAWVSACTPHFLFRVFRRAWLCACSACTPPLPVLVCGVGVRAEVWFSAAPRHSLGRCGGLCVLVCPSRLVSCTSWLGGCCARVCGWAWVVPRPATPGWGVAACVCLCGHPACTPPFLAGVCFVGVRAGLGFRLWPALLDWVVGVCVRSCVCPACPRPSLGAACGTGMCGCCCWWGLPPPPSPLVLVFFLRGAGPVLASWCRSLAVPVLGLVVDVPPSPLFRAALFVFFFVPAWCVSACFGRPLSRWAAAPGLLLPVLVGWSPCAPLSGPVLGAVWPGGLAASCGVGGRFGGCGPFSRPPPCLNFGGGLPVPPSAFPGLPHALVGIQCGLPGCCCWLRFHAVPLPNGLGGLCTRWARRPFLPGYGP